MNIENRFEDSSVSISFKLTSDMIDAVCKALEFRFLDDDLLIGDELKYNKDLLLFFYQIAEDTKRGWSAKIELE